MEPNLNSSPSVPVVQRPASKGGGLFNKQKFSPENGGRVKGIKFVKPIVYGNVAWHLGTKRADDHTHQWNVYLKAYDNDDMSLYVKRVHFKLHESYSESNRVCYAPPYQVTETGWGEFEVVIKIFFQDSNERPVTIYHFLKLFEREKNGMVKSDLSPVSSELYDELVFVDPTVKMHKLLSQPRASPLGAPKHKVDFEEKKVKDLLKMLEAKSKVKQEITELRAKLAGSKSSIAQLKSQIAS